MFLFVPLMHWLAYIEYRNSVGVCLLTQSEFSDKLSNYANSLLVGGLEDGLNLVYDFSNTLTEQLELPSKDVHKLSLDSMLSYASKGANCAFFNVDSKEESGYTKCTVGYRFFRSPNGTPVECSSFLVKYTAESEADFLKRLETEYNKTLESMKNVSDSTSIFDAELDLENRFPLLDVDVRLLGSSAEVAEVSASVKYTDITYAPTILELRKE